MLICNLTIGIIFLNSNDSVDNMWTKFLHELNACVELYIPSEQINHDAKIPRNTFTQNTLLNC